MKKITKASIISAVLVVFLAVLAGQVGAQSITTKFKIVNHITKMEMAPAGDEKGHVVGVIVRGGLALLENGEVAFYSAVMSFDSIFREGWRIRHLYHLYL